MAYVYQHIRLDTNEVFYVGIGKTKYRAYKKTGRNEHWKRIVNKAGYDIQIIAENISYEEALSKEKELIEYYGRRDKGSGTLVNMTDGGGGVLGLKIGHLSDEHKQKVSASLKGKSRTEETKKKISESQKGKKMSEESRKKMSDASKGKKRSDKFKQALKDRKLSDEQKQKISRSLSGKKGQPCSEETRQKISMTLKNKVK